MKKELTALLIAGILSCSSPSAKQDYAPKLIAINFSGIEVSIVEDTNNDGELDLISRYSVIRETKPGSSIDDPDDYFILELENREKWIPPSKKNIFPSPVPEYRNKDFKDKPALNARLSY